MGNYFIIAVLIVVIIIALHPTIMHFKGKGGCCGDGGEVIAEKKKLNGKVVAKKLVKIDGMHCKNCALRVENSLNRIDGAVSKVNYKDGTALLTSVNNIEDEEIRKAINGIEYKVTDIITLEV